MRDGVYAEWLKTQEEVFEMDAFYHQFSELFSQIGLSREPADIRAFIEKNSPLSAEVRLEDAPFWSAAQATLLREKLQDDADWSEVVDQLNIALRARRG